MPDLPILLDVSRLIWRRWGGHIPTGIDRVCLAYLDHFQFRSQAVVQFRGFHRILDRRRSAELFDLLLNEASRFRLKLVRILAKSSLTRASKQAGKLYLNVGHTGLDSPYLIGWTRDQGVRPVHLIHDLIPITHPQYCRPGEAARHRQRISNALRSAHGIIVNSQDTARELGLFASSGDLPLPPCAVAWLGTGETKPVEPGPATIPYFVMVGTIEARKNHLLVLDAWQELVGRLGDEAPELVIIGQRGWEAQEAFDRLDNPGPLAGKVRELGRCDDAELISLISGARALLMPSFAEGFGLPLIEALELGTPVIASDLGVFREIAGDIPRYLHPRDKCGWAEAVIALASNGPEHQRQKKLMTSFQPARWPDHFRTVERFLGAL